MLRLFQKNSLRIMNKLRFLVVHKQDHGKMLTMHLEEPLFHQMQKPEVPAGYVVRNYQENDYWQVNMLYIKSNIGFCDIEYFKPNMLPNAHKVIVDENTGRVIASLFGIQSFEDSDVERMEWMAVDKKHRRRGLAAVLLYIVTSKLVTAKYQRLELNTFEKMGAAIATYTNNGWRHDK